VKPQAKVSRVMREFKKGDLKSSSGQKVTNPKQAIAIGLSEAGISKKAKGGEMKESKAMMKKEVSFMKKKGAPKSMVKHEEAEMKGMKKGGNVKKMAFGGKLPSKLSAAMQAVQNPKPMTPLPGPKGSPTLSGPRNIPKESSGPGFSPSGVPLNRGPKSQTMAGGGLAAGHKSADGVATKGKTKAKQIVMAGSGKGMKHGGMTKMKKGGYC
jgi:hypothetical protein